MSRFDLPPEVMPFGELLPRATDPGETWEQNVKRTRGLGPERCWRPYPENKALQVNGVGQLRTNFVEPVADASDNVMLLLDNSGYLHKHGNWDNSGNDVLVQGHWAEGGIRVPNPDVGSGDGRVTLSGLNGKEYTLVCGGSGSSDSGLQMQMSNLQGSVEKLTEQMCGIPMQPYQRSLLDAIGIAQAREQAAAQADAATRASRGPKQVSLNFSEPVPVFTVRRTGHDIPLTVTAAELTDGEVLNMMGMTFDSRAHYLAWNKESERLHATFTIKNDEGYAYTTNLRQAEDWMVGQAYQDAEDDSELEQVMHEECVRRGI